MTDDLTADHPTADGSEHAWRLGRAAGLAESAANANPYEPGSELAADWADGWREGDKLSHRSVDSDQAWAAWRARADPGEPNPGEPEHAHAP